MVDSHSEDGAWEFIQNEASKDQRIRISQAPRGLYQSWNKCIREARGEYVYFATSDDSMTPDCLERMVGAMEMHPECGLCQCDLKIIDAAGQVLKGKDAAGKIWPVLWQGFTFGRFAKDWLNRRHIRYAPLDGVLHFALETIYTSITQLLIRRCVFERVGLFDETLGTVGDFEWGMRAGLLENCIFVPETLAAWRIHPQQVSNGANIITVRRKMLAMTKVAFQRAQEKSVIDLKRWPLEEMLRFYRQQLIVLGFKRVSSRRRGIAFLAAEILRGNIEALKYVFSRRQRHLFEETAQFDALRSILKRMDVAAPLIL